MIAAPRPEHSLKYDLHLHSRNSFDSLTSPLGIVRAARRAGLAGIAVTDHGTIAGGQETRALAPEGLLVIVGAEIYTTVGDIVCLFLTEEISSRDPLEVVAETHRQGGVAFLPHPLRSHPGPISDRVLDALDGYEALNGRAGFFDPISAPNRGTNWHRLAGKGILGNSDAHFEREIGRAYTLIEGPPTEENVRGAIRERRLAHGGAVGGPFDFYCSQLVKMIKTRDPAMLLRLGRRVLGGRLGHRASGREQ